MGNVRTEQIKRTGKELMRRFPNRFSNDFRNNKTIVNEVIKGGTPKVRNQIAGYITRSLAAQQNAIAEVEEEGIEQVQAEEEK